MSINKNWMVEDNFAIMTERNKEKLLYTFVQECMLAILVSCDGGRRHKKPGQAVAWYLDRMVDQEKADYIRANLKPKHMIPWSELDKAVLLDNDERDKVSKYPRRGHSKPKEWALRS